MEPTPTTPTPPPSAPTPTSPKATPKVRAAVHFEDAEGAFKTVCRTFMRNKCARPDCKFVHDPLLCVSYWKTGVCKLGDACEKKHVVTGDVKPPAAAATDGEKTKKERKPKDKKKKEDTKKPAAASEAAGEEKDKESKQLRDKKKDKKAPKDANKQQPQGKVRAVRGKNTECFEPMTKPVDLRITYDLGSATETFTTSLTSRDLLLAPNIFSEFKKGELYATLLNELEGCGIPEERLMKMWHGNDKLDGTHLIADDKTKWKATCPTFQLVVDRLQKFFSLNVQATRFNWYKDSSQWKPFHFDAAAVKPEIAAKQNFTVGVSFGMTRDAAFEHAKSKTVVSVPQPDSCVYAFARDTNIIWRHGILQDAPVRQEGRISVIAWGWIDGMVDPLEAPVEAPVKETK